MPSFTNVSNGTIAHNIINDANHQINYHGCTIYIVDQVSGVPHQQSTPWIDGMVRNQEERLLGIEGVTSESDVRSESTELSLLAGSLGLLQRIERLLRDEAGPLDAHLQFQLDSLSHTLYLVSLAAKIARSTPLADSLYRFIRPRVDECHSLLQQIFDMIDQYRMGLLPFKIWSLWQKVFLWAKGDGRDIDTVQRELRSAQQSLDKILLALKSVIWTGLSNDAVAKLPTFRAFLTHHHDTPSLRHIQLQKIVVVDHLGTSLPIPLEFCSSLQASLQDIDYLLLGYCQDRIGMRYILDGEYQLIESTSNRTISASVIARILKPETVLEMSIILRQLQSRASVKDSRRRCPRCHHLNLVIPTADGWIECTNCSGNFVISVADTRGVKRPNDEVPSPRIVGKRRRVEKPRTMLGIQEGNDLDEMHEARDNRSFDHQMTVSQRAQTQDERMNEIQFFRRVHVHLTMPDLLGVPDQVEMIEVIHRVSEKITRQPSILVGGMLKEYQLKVLQWMVSLYNNRLNGIFVDGTGDGTVIQIISLITFLIEVKHHRGPYLAVVPFSTITKWAGEFAKWAPAVRTIVYKGNPAQRRTLQDELRMGQFQVLLTTYEYIIKDQPHLSKIKWVHMIIDEGLRMKNTQSKLAQTLTTYYHSRYRLILTGTPPQNNLSKLWALLNFVLPKIFNSIKSFDEWFNTPFANSGTGDKIELDEEEAVLVLCQVLRPFLLTTGVWNGVPELSELPELPDKVKKVIKVRMRALQSQLYKQMKETDEI